MRRLAILLAAAVWPASGALQAQTRSAVVAPEPASNRDADGQVARFFDGLRAGQVNQALEVMFASSPLLAERTSERQAIATQIEGILRLYGPLRAHELVASSTTGTLHLKQVYLVQLERTLIRWEFHFARLPRGWTMSHFSLNDEIQNWP